MECLYRIVGQQINGKKIKLTIIPTEPEEKILTSGILSNIGGFIEDMKSQAMQSKNPDSISIPFDVWEKAKMGIGAVLKVNIDV